MGCLPDRSSEQTNHVSSLRLLFVPIQVDARVGQSENGTCRTYEYDECSEESFHSNSIGWHLGTSRSRGRSFSCNDVCGQYTCLLYTSDAADDLLCVDLGGRRIIKKKKKE